MEKLNMGRKIIALIASGILLANTALAQVTTNPNVTGIAVNNVTGTLGISNGGTGATTAQAAAQALAAPRIIGKSAIPFVSLSSCTMSAVGALSACTALPIAYANAYCYMPANAVAAVSAAGWYFCQFSTTTDGTVFLDTYTAGIPTIPGSPTAVTAGSSFTGDVNEECGTTITVPANAMGANGALRLMSAYQVNNTANNKIYRVKYSGASGTVFATYNAVNNLASRHLVEIANRGAANSQIGSDTGAGTGLGGFGNIAGALVPGAIDTTVATTVVFCMQKFTATDNMVLESILVELLSDGT